VGWGIAVVLNAEDVYRSDEDEGRIHKDLERLKKQE
jgi:hypothetical protein